MELQLLTGGEREKGKGEGSEKGGRREKEEKEGWAKERMSE